MIPDHIIEKARQAMIALPSPRNPKPTADALVRTALEAVAADIWDDGYVAGVESAHEFFANNINADTPNPYERIEHT